MPDVRLVGAAQEVIDDFTVATVPQVTAALSEPLLTAADVADLLAVPRSSVYEYARRVHSLAAVGPHRPASPVPASEVEAWLVDQR